MRKPKLFITALLLLACLTRTPPPEESLRATTGRGSVPTSIAGIATTDTTASEAVAVRALPPAA